MICCTKKRWSTNLCTSKKIVGPAGQLSIARLKKNGEFTREELNKDVSFRWTRLAQETINKAKEPEPPTP